MRRNPIAERNEGFRKIAAATRWALAGGLALSGAIAAVAAGALPTKASGARPDKTAASSSAQRERYSDLWGSGSSRYGDLTGLTPPSNPPQYVQAPPMITSGGS